LRRSVVLWLFGASMSPLFALAAITMPVGRLVCALLVLWLLGYPLFLATDAYLLARQNRTSPLKRYQRWWFYVVMYVAFLASNAAVAVTVRSFVAEAFVVPGRSMSPTIQHRDRIVVDKLWGSPERLERGDVVVFRSDGPGSPLFVMRVAGLPGEQIEIKNERVFIDGAIWNDDRAVFQGPLPPEPDLPEGGALKIPSDCFFVLGDNRRRSYDSRWLGPIPFSDFYGIGRMVYWSQDHTFPDPDDTSRSIPGRIRWDRIGQRLD
jgi:signal peptidase I